MDALKSVSCVDVQRNPALRGQIQGIARRLRDLSIISIGFADAMKESCEAFGAVSNKIGIALLPDEVLIMIFDLVLADVEDSDKHITVSCLWKAAVNLSHVDQHFRSVMLDCPRFWTNMSSCGEMVEACFPRTKGLPLKVHLNISYCTDSEERYFDPVLAELLPLAKYWGRLDIIISHIEEDERSFKNTTGETLRQLDAPLLNELNIKAVPFPEFQNFNLDCAQWNSPNLRSVIAFECFPLYLPGLSNVFDLFVMIRVDDEKISEILGEIKRMQNLRYLSLEMSNTHYPGNIDVFERFEFPQVERLRIVSELHFRKDDSSPALKRSIFSSLFFPGAKQLVLEIKGGDYMDYESETDWDENYTRDYLFNTEINRIFRHVDQFPRVKIFAFNILSPRGVHRNSVMRSEAYIPLNMLPSVKHLRLNSNMRFDVKEPEDPDEILFDDEIAVAPRVTGNRLPILDSITLCMRKPSRLAEWVREYLLRVKDREMWNGLFELNLKELKKSGIRSTRYIGDKALNWCEDRVNRTATQERN
ncbi:hypothetical protein SCHPADRAFT_1003189 [Schizopora paradoxa]|uniref:F-box domain-containing protein n=1 Tax=Schizopora paradoxa TaxID=27342 RepID=A0A0H2R5R0_9AGAM|nr:hypothetical protein SCHPADRAFT_1003189 [Schizopora paradoxa]